MRATNGFLGRGILPFPVTFSSWCLFGCLAVSSDLPLFIDWHLFSTHLLPISFCSFFFHSRSSSSPSFHLLPFVLFYSGSFSVSRGTSARTLSIRRNLLIASFPDGGEECTFPSWGNKWTWSRNWFSCPDDKDFSARLFLTISSFLKIAKWIFRVSIRDAST